MMLWNEYDIQDLVESFIAEGKKVTFLNMTQYLSPVIDFKDTVHPNQQGYDKMADAWTTAIRNIVSPTGDKYAPEIIRAETLDRYNITVTFSKGLSDDSILDLNNFEVGNGLQVIDAKLSQEKRHIIISTSSQILGENCSISIKGVTDRTDEKRPMLDTQRITFRVGWRFIALSGWNDIFENRESLESDIATLQVIKKLYGGELMMVPDMQGLFIKHSHY